MRPPIISPVRWPLRRPQLPTYRTYRWGLSDWIDTGGYVPPDSATPECFVAPCPGDTTAPWDPQAGLPPMVITAPAPSAAAPQAQPLWPLLAILGAAGYALFWAGGHK